MITSYIIYSLYGKTLNIIIYSHLLKYISTIYKLYLRLSLAALSFLLLPANSRAQTGLLTDDKTSSGLILQTMDSIYNLNFPAARKIIPEIEKRLPEHPGLFLLKAFLTGQEHVPLKSGTKAYGEFEELLQRTLEISEKLLDKNKNDVEGIFFSLAAHGYLAQLYADNNKNLKAAGQAKDAYDFIKAGFGLTGSFPDFYFPCGLYNYYRVAYPELHPYYKTVVWLFREGDKKSGIEMLKKGAAKGLFTKTESLSYLGHIFLRYENKPLESLPYNEKLVRSYPRNLTFSLIYVENLLKLKKCYQARPYIDRLRKSDKAYFQYAGEIFYGCYLLTALSDLHGALNAYNRAEKIAARENIRNPHFDSILYLGLGRINKKMGNANTAKSFFEKALESAVFPAQKIEAKAFLE